MKLDIVRVSEKSWNCSQILLCTHSAYCCDSAYICLGSSSRAIARFCNLHLCCGYTVCTYITFQFTGMRATATFAAGFADARQSRIAIRSRQPFYPAQELCEQIKSRWDVIKISISHRTGIVAVGDASVIIAVSSAHRVASLEAVHWAIDELKATVPIWKKEFFADGSTWKENPESRRLLEPRQKAL